MANDKYDIPDEVLENMGAMYERIDAGELPDLDELEGEAEANETSSD